MRTLLLFCLLPFLSLHSYAQTSPVISTASPAFGSQGSTIKVTITGMNFTATSLVTSSGAGVGVDATTYLSPTQLEVTVALRGTPGPYSLRVSNGTLTSNAVEFAMIASVFSGASELDVDAFVGPEGGAGYTDGSGATTKFADPTGIWGDGTYLYIADGFNSVIRRVKISSGETTTIAGMAGAPAWRGGIGSEARFWAPHGLWGFQGSLYITDTGNYTVRKLDLATNTVTTVAGTPNEPGSTNGTFARFAGPTGIWGDATTLYIADTLSQGSRSIRKIVLDTGMVSTVADLGATSGIQLYGVGIWGDGAGTLYIADSARHIIRRLSIGSGSLTTLAGTDGTPGATAGSGTAARFNFPSAISGLGTTLYIGDTVNYSIRAISISSALVSPVSGVTARPGWVDGSSTVAQFGTIGGIWASATNLYVSERTNHDVRRVELQMAR